MICATVASARTIPPMRSRLQRLCRGPWPAEGPRVTTLERLAPSSGRRGPLAQAGGKPRQPQNTSSKHPTSASDSLQRPSIAV
jgi:hypothetical protein